MCLPRVYSTRANVSIPQNRQNVIRTCNTYKYFTEPSDCHKNSQYGEKGEHRRIIQFTIFDDEFRDGATFGKYHWLRTKSVSESDPANNLQPSTVYAHVPQRTVPFASRPKNAAGFFRGPQRRRTLFFDSLHSVLRCILNASN